MATIYLLRHSETEYSRLHNICGVSDPPLSEEGVVLAKARAQVLDGLHFEAIFSSPSKRAYQTLETMLPGAAYSIDKRLREIDFGELEGHPISEVFLEREDTPGTYDDDWKTYSFPGGDNMVDYWHRAGEMVREYDARPEGAILLVSHNGFINSVIANLVFRDIDKLFTVPCPTCGLVRLSEKNGQFSYTVL